MQKLPADPTQVPVFILAGGLGTRLAEETGVKPKPMVEIGGIPMLLHIMRYYHSFGFNDFVICAGYFSYYIKDYFARYELLTNHVEVDHRLDPASTFKVFGHSNQQERWRVRVIETGKETMTGARVARALDVYTEADGAVPENFALTYGDGLTNSDLGQQLDFHLNHGKIGTVLGVKPVARFGELNVDADGSISGFLEKPASRHSYMNGGFFFFKQQFREYLSIQADCVLEASPLEKVAQDGQLKMWAKADFWQCMDSLRDKITLEQLWLSENCPWRRNTPAAVENHTDKQTRNPLLRAI